MDRNLAEKVAEVVLAHFGAMVAVYVLPDDDNDGSWKVHVESLLEDLEDIARDSIAAKMA